MVERFTRKPRINIEGETYGSLKVGKYIYSTPTASTYSCDHHYECICVCGTKLTVIAGNLRSGNTTSCGCAKIGRTGRKKKVI